MNFSGTYTHCTPTSTNASNLLYYAMNFESFKDSDFVIFQDSQYSYYIVWGSLEVEESGALSSLEDVEYIHYYRTDTSTYNSTYMYENGSDSSFVLESDYVCTTNVPEFGFASATYDNYKLNNNVGMSLVLVLAFLFVIMVTNLRGGRS